MRIYRTAAPERISADDPDAKKKIAARIQELQALINNAQTASEIVQAARKTKRPDWAARAAKALREMGVDAGDIERIVQISPSGRYAVPYDEIVASRADIERLRERLEKLDKRDARPAEEKTINGVRIVENREANRLQLFFDGKPSEEVRAALRSRGFLWAPSQQAWQRQLTDSAREAALSILRRHSPAAASAPAPRPAPPAPPPAAPPPPPAAPLTVSRALQSWTAASNTVQVRIARALERAKTTSAGQAGVAVGRNRLEVRRDAEGAWSIVWPRTGEPAFFVDTFAKKARAAKEPKSAGGSWTKASIVRDFERRELAQVNDQIKAVRKARGDELAEQRGQCKTLRKDASQKHRGDDRRVAVAEARQKCAATFAETERKRAAELRELRNRKPAPKRRASAGPQRARERLAERDDAVASELARRGRADLVKLWNQVKGEPRYKGASADRAIERFTEAVEEDRQQVEKLQEDRGNVSDDAFACEQAHAQAKAGDPIAAQFAEENCDGERPRKKRESPAMRTRTMLDLPNPEIARLAAEAEAKKKAKAEAKKKPRPGKPAPRGQQSLGTTFTPLVDAGGPQLSLDTPRRARRAAPTPDEVPF